MNTKEQAEFIAVLKYYNLYQEEELYKIICPFHGDKNPSMQINLLKSYFYCYGCGAHGSTYELVKEFNPDCTALQIYSKISKILKKEEVKFEAKNEIKIIDKKPTYSEGIKLAKDYYFNLPTTNWYKVSEEVLGIKRYMNKRGFKTSTLIKFEAKATYNEFYPIVFPLYDNGIFRGYVMRTDDPTVEDQRKYMYNSGFKRRVSLPGNYKNDTVVLVEGFLDRIKGEQIGIKNIAALLGWKITAEQIEKLKKSGVKKIICALDNDEAGIKGYKYLKRISEINNFELVRLRYPKGMKDMGDVNEKNASLILNQVRKFGGK